MFGAAVNVAGELDGDRVFTRRGRGAPLDYSELEHWTRVGSSHATGSGEVATVRS
jgi:hypothetical protein